MSHLYPLAETVRDALTDDRPVARTRHDAERLAGATEVIALETEWVTEDSAKDMMADASAKAGMTTGFVQNYEDANGAPVFAVTYWRLAGPIVPLDESPGSDRLNADDGPPQTAEQNAGNEIDHTDDLYFRAGRTRKRRKRYIDPRQMDLFVSADARGYDRADPNNPDVIIPDEEGDGTTFGG